MASLRNWVEAKMPRQRQDCKNVVGVKAFLGLHCWSARGWLKETIYRGSDQVEKKGMWGSSKENIRPNQ